MANSPPRAEPAAEPAQWLLRVAASGGGLRLVSVGFAMVRDEPGLIAVPVVAFLAQLVVIGIGALIVWPAFHGADTSGGGSVHLSAAQWLGIVAVGVLVTFISVVSHATIIARVMARFHGRRITNIKAVGAAMTKSPQLLAWAFINYIVISVLRSIGNRGILGLLVGWLLRAGWMLASFFVVPVILFENRGAVSSIKRSVELCRARWGENMIGNSALGVIGFAARGCRYRRRRPVGFGVRASRGGGRSTGAGVHPAGAHGGLGGVQRRPLLVRSDRPVPGPVLGGRPPVGLSPEVGPYRHLRVLRARPGSGRGEPIRAGAAPEATRAVMASTRPNED